MKKLTKKDFGQWFSLPEHKEELVEAFKNYPGLISSVYLNNNQRIYVCYDKEKECIVEYGSKEKVDLNKATKFIHYLLPEFKMNCNCIQITNHKIGEHFYQLDTDEIDGVEVVVVNMINKNRFTQNSQEKAAITPNFCPFCGTPYPKINNNENPLEILVEFI